ncbi:MAG: WD40 repeat domain-containing protein, partial [Leptolyngbya sp. SIO4C5]|nr:WD40 repeat domain-containing protein [Leptolyngbya sp. SIO4C5]
SWATCRPVAQLNHAWGLRALAFTPEGHTLVSSSADETLKIWQLDT